MEAAKTIDVDNLIEREIKDSFCIEHWENRMISNPEILRATYNRLFLISEGHGSLYVDDKAFQVFGKQLLLIGRGQIFSFDKFSILTGYELIFGDCFWEKAPASSNNCKAVLFNNITSNQNLKIPAGQFQEFSFLFEALFTEFAGEDYINKTDALAAYLKIIMIKTGNLNKSLAEATDDFESKLYNHFLELVARKYHEIHDVSQYANQLNISARKLSEICKLHSGKGPKDIINNQLITEAKRALQFTMKPVKEIAYELDFSTAEQFSHFFKKYTKISPQHYRSGFVKIGM